MKNEKNKGFQLIDGKLNANEAFSVSDSIMVRAQGLKENTVYTVDLFEHDKLLFSSDFMSNREGTIFPTVLWAQFGLDDPNGEKTYTLKEAQERWHDSTILVQFREKDEVYQELKFITNPELNHSVVLATNNEGRVRNGYSPNDKQVCLTVANLPKASSYQVLLVERQQEWRVGDPLNIVKMRSGRSAVFTIDARKEGIDTILLAEVGEFLPGAYDFVIRPERYGFEDNQSLSIIATDILPYPTITGLVIREEFWTAKPVLGGCVNKLPISGRSISGTPYFRYGDTFGVGEDVWGALDPGIVDPSNLSKMCAMYVVPSKTDIQWNNSNALNHLPVLGGNSSVQKFKVQSGCINGNKRLLWSAAMDEGEYDIVADFGNNVPDAASFVQDDAYNTPLDIIDGYFVAGFRVVKDPGTMQDFAHVGNWNYTQATQGTATVQDELTHYHNPGSFTAVNANVDRSAHVYFPADVAGATAPNQISNNNTDYPVIVIIHGNGHSYTSYDFLLQHFAHNGFIAASIHLNGGMSALGRANMLFEHMTILNNAFGNNIQNNIGIMGHSRGGEAVLKAARLNDSGLLGHNINAIISLAPTDQYGSEVLSGSYSTPYFVLYGSRDGDINGGQWTPGYTVPQTGFALYDRTDGDVKSMSFVHKATHNGFITTNYDADFSDIPSLISEVTQQAITKAYMNAFFRQHLMSEPQWRGIFMGEWQPSSVESTSAEMYMQYSDPNAKVVDDFEGGISNWQASTIGGTVTDNNTLPVNPSEGKMHDHPSATGLDDNSPHDTKGLLIRWDSNADELIFNIPAAHKNVSTYDNLSFRVSQREASPHNAANQSQKMRVALKDGSGNERAIRISAFSSIPFPDQRSNASLRKSAMHTVRIPLTSYTIVCAGQMQVDLTDIVSISFKFTPNNAGEIEMDSIEFSD